MADVLSTPRARQGDPAWALVDLMPPQGYWTEHDFLSLTTNRLVELVDGHVEVLPMPTQIHQLILGFIYSAITAFTAPRRLGVVLVAGTRIKVGPKQFREPDVCFMLTENAARRGDEYWDGADLVVEIVSRDDPQRDYKDKRLDYATAGIAEYWIVDPEMQVVEVLKLVERQYLQHLAATRGQVVTSVLLAGFSVNADNIFDAGMI